MIIYNPNGTTLLDIEVDDSSAAYAEVMNRDDVTLEFSLAEYTNIPLGAYITFEGKRYQMLVPASVTVVNRRNYAYTVTFETDQGKLRIWRIHNIVDGRVVFSLTARPSEHLAMFVANLNEREGSNLWAVAPGSYNEGEITLSYNKTTILDGISQLADECETEWEVFKEGNKVYLSLGKVEYNEAFPLALSYGENGGFESGVKRTNTGGGLPVQFVYVQGGDRNIDPSTYYNRSHYLLLPRNYSFSFDGEYFNGETGYDASKAVAMVTDANGYYVKLASAVRGAAEESLDLSDIYPKRVGTVWGVETEQSSTDVPFYNIIDESLGTASGKLNLNYNNYLIEGSQFTIVFQSGMLTGREIGVHKFTLEANRGVFELCQEQIDGFIMPGEGGYVPAVGNTYAVFGCALPAQYIADSATHSGAEFDMLRKAARYVYENKDAKQTFKGTLSKVYARKNWQTIGPKMILGQYVSFTDESVQSSPVLMRILAIKRYINNPYKPEIELSNEATKGTVGSSIQQLSNNFAHTDRRFKESYEYTNRRWRDAKESQDALAEALLEEFSEGISPVTIQTMSALIGSENLQFEIFTNTSYNQYVTPPSFNNAGQLVCRAGYVKHYTLGFTDADYVKSERPNTEYFRWQIAAKTFSFTDEGPYYLYVKATKPSSKSTVGTAEYMLSKTGIPFEPTTAGSNYDTSHYYMLLAIVSSEVEGSRSIATYNGFTEITPGQIRAMKWISNDGQQFIDFINKSFRIGDTSKFLGYNIGADGNYDGQGRLRLKGTIIQSPSGDTFPAPCNRGAYSASTAYYYGDLVTYGGQSWLYINQTSSTGRTPTEGSYWMLYAAKGTDGAAGSFKSTAFMRTNTNIGSETYRPTGGTYASPLPTSKISGVAWSDGIPSGQAILWATTATFVAGQGSPTWSIPRQMTDTETFDVEFAKMQTNDAVPATPTTANRHGGSGTQIWFDPDLDSSEDFTKMYWRAERECINGSWGNWTIQRIKGEKGDGGQFKSIVFKRNASQPSTPTGGSYNSPVPSGWSDGVPSGTSILWMSTCIFEYGSSATPVWSTPTQVTDTADIDFEFSAVASNPGNPTSNPSNWHNTATSSDIWMAVRKCKNGVWGSWEVSKIKGENGVGINSVDEYYAASTSGTSAPADSAFTKNAIPSNFNITNKYLWNYEEITYTVGNPTKTEKTVIGVYGKDGKGLTAVTEYYLASASASGVTRSTSGWTTTMQYPDATKQYLWNYERLTWNDNGTESYTYTDPAIIGHFGKDGQDGTRGKVMRGRSEWSASGYGGSGRYQGRDTDFDVNNQYIDIVLYTNPNTGEALTYLCKQSHTASASITPLNTAYWEEMNNFSMVATSALYAERALIEDLGATHVNTDTQGVGYGVDINGNDIAVSDSAGVKVRISGDSDFFGAAGSGTFSGSGTAKTATKAGTGNVTHTITCFSGMNITSGANVATISAFSCMLSAADGNEIDDEASIYARLESTAGDIIILGATEGKVHNFASLNIPQITGKSIKNGTWSLVVEFNATFDSQRTMSCEVSATSISGTYKSTSELTEIIGTGFKTIWSGEGFKATSAGAKVIHGGIVLEALGSVALNGLTAPVKFVFCTAYPSTMEANALYLKVS